MAENGYNSEILIMKPLLVAPKALITYNKTSLKGAENI